MSSQATKVETSTKIGPNGEAITTTVTTITTTAANGTKTTTTKTNTKTVQAAAAMRTPPTSPVKAPASVTSAVVPSGPAKAVALIANAGTTIHTALKAFKSSHPQDVELEAGDRVEIIRRESDEWASGKNLRSNKSGSFPLHCVLPVNRKLETDEVRRDDQYFTPSEAHPRWKATVPLWLKEAASKIVPGSAEQYLDDFHPALRKLRGTDAVKDAGAIPITFKESDFVEVDKRAVATPPAEEKDMARLVNYLTALYKDPLFKVRAIFKWICENIRYDVNSYLTGRIPPQSADKTFATRIGVCAGYSKLFHEMCDLASKQANIKIESVCVIGGSTGAMAQAGDPYVDLEEHEWNAVKVRGAWWLLDCTWAAGCIDGHTNSFRKRFNPHYFLADPRVFIHTHIPRPSEIRYQFLVDPLTPEEFLCLPFAKEGFFSHAFRIVRCSATAGTTVSARMISYMEVADGSFEVVLESPAAEKVDMAGGVGLMAKLEFPVEKRDAQGLGGHKVVYIEGAPHRHGVKTRGNGGGVLCWSETKKDAKMTRHYVKGFCPAIGDGVLSISVFDAEETQKSGPHTIPLLPVIEFRVKNTAMMGAYCAPPILYPSAVKAAHPIYKDLKVGTKVHFRACGETEAVVMSPGLKKIFKMERIAGDKLMQEIEVNVDVPGDWTVGCKSSGNTYAFAAIYKAA
ncbi:hypothetical protein HK101_005112 [Irineochytrium annulatum]|nr:hypothetical protein HK101_005112 [Irineochytrium annulatum]